MNSYPDFSKTAVPRESLWLQEFRRIDFQFRGRPVTVVLPPTPLQGRFWVWKGEFLDAFPNADIALLRKGFFLVYLSFPDQFGGPVAMARWTELYKELTRRHRFSRKVALMGLSRGGLYCYHWAAQNADKVACIYGDAPVCDFRSWPGGKGKGPGSSDEWEKLKKVFGFHSDAQAIAYSKNAVDNLAPLAAAHIPILHVYGDADEVVPWKENTGILAERYRALGGAITLIGKPGCGHHPHGLEDPAPVVDFILQHTVHSAP